MKKYLSMVFVLTCLLALTACGKKADPIVLPEVSDIISIDVTVDENTTNHSDAAWITDVISGVSQAKPTSKQSVNDAPQTETYSRIDIQLKDGTNTLFAFADDGKYYVERPYVGIYEIDAALFEQINRTN